MPRESERGNLKMLLFFVPHSSRVERSSLRGHFLSATASFSIVKKKEIFSNVVKKFTVCSLNTALMSKGHKRRRRKALFARPYKYKSFSFYFKMKNISFQGSENLDRKIYSCGGVANNTIKKWFYSNCYFYIYVWFFFFFQVKHGGLFRSYTYPRGENIIIITLNMQMRKKAGFHE